MQTLGQTLVNDLLPDDLKATGPLDKKELHKRLYEYAKRDPAKAAIAMDKLRRLGHEIATTEGTSIGLNDITPEYGTRNAILKPLLKKFQKIDDPTKRQKFLLEHQAKLQKASANFHGSQGELVRSGSRGAPTQLMRSFMAPVAARDAQGGVVPWLVHHSYSEGLRPSEAFATSIETRLNLIASNLAVTEPGDFSKILVNNMGDQLVLSEDCGTHNGIPMSTEDPNIIDRYLARPVGGFSYNTLITPHTATKLRKSEKTIVVRSPMTCELHDGVCQRCYGQNERGKLHKLGTNIGVRSAQAITEPLTQFTLSAKHGVRTGGETKPGVTGLKGLRQFLEIPETFMNKAALTSTEGKVTKIEKAPQGGHNVFVGTNSFYVPPHLKPSVRVGQTVRPGDALSDGVPMPNEVVQYKGLGAGRKYVVDKLYDIYRDQGVDLDKRHFEVLARTHLNHVQIDSDPENRFYPGELVNYATLQKYLAEDTKKVALQSAAGQVLARGYLQHSAGTVVTPEIIEDLKRQGIKTIEIATKPPVMSFHMQPITSNPLLNPDWMARLGHRKLKASILEGAHFAQKSDIHGTHPIPAFVYGKEFGTGPKGRY